MNIISYILTGIIVLLVGLSTGLWIDNQRKSSTIQKQELKIGTLSTEVLLISSNNKQLVDRIEIQNAGIQAMGAVKDSIDLVFADFTKRVDQTQKTVAGIREAIKAEDTPTSCEDAIQYLREVGR